MYLRELLRLMHPRFYQHLAALGEDGLQMLFCHRWILLCFKREFPEAEALRMWEACWAHYQVRLQSAIRCTTEQVHALGWPCTHACSCLSPCPCSMLHERAPTQAKYHCTDPAPFSLPEL